MYWRRRGVWGLEILAILAVGGVTVVSVCVRQVASAAPCAFAKVVDPPVGEVLAFDVPWGTIRPPTLRWRSCWLPSGCSHSRLGHSCPGYTDRLRAVGWFLGAAAAGSLYLPGRDGVAWKLTFVVERIGRPAVPCQLFCSLIFVLEKVNVVGEPVDGERLPTTQNQHPLAWSWPHAWQEGSVSDAPSSCLSDGLLNIVSLGWVMSTARTRCWTEIASLMRTDPAALK